MPHLQGMLRLSFLDYLPKRQQNPRQSLLGEIEESVQGLSSLPAEPTAVHAPFDKLPPNLQNTHVWPERHFFETLDFSKGK